MSTPRYRQIIYRFPLLVFLVTSLVLSVLLRVGEPRIVGIVFGSLFLIAVFGVPLLAIAFCVFDITKFLQAPRIFRRPEAEVQIKVDIPDRRRHSASGERRLVLVPRGGVLVRLCYSPAMLSTTLSIRRYSRASSDDMKLSRSVSRSMVSRSCPVCLSRI